MAVEIPVVIDIDKAFDDAIKKLPSAMRPLKNTIDQLSQELNVARQLMAEAPIDSKDWKDAAKWVQGLSQSLDVANDKMRKLSANEGSIRQLTSSLASVNRRWAEMGSSQKYDAKGRLSGDALKLIGEYDEIAEQLRRNKTLTQIWADSQARLAKLAEKQAAAAKAAQDKEFMMSAPANTLGGLQKQESLLTTAMRKAVIGSDEYNRYQKQLKEVRGAMAQAQVQADNYTVSLARQSGALDRLTGQFASYVSIYSLLRFAKQIRDVTGELEYQRVALQHLIQDEEYGSQLFERIKAAAIESPFRIKDLVTYTKQLAAFRIEQEELFPTMMRLADISAGLGVDMDRLILAYGQVRAASVLRGQELRQFTEAGIPLVDLLAEKFSELNGKAIKTSDVFELISKRAVPFSMIAEIFEDLTEKGGMFYQMQEKQAATLAGRWEKLKDAYDIGLQSVGNTKTFEVYNNLVLGVLNLIAKNLRLLPKLIEGVSAAWLIYYLATTKARLATRKAAMAEIEEATAKEAQSVANMRGIKHVNAYTYALTRQKVATNALSRSFWKLWAAVVASPVAAAVAAIGAIAAALFLFRKRTDDAVNSYQEFDDLIDSTSSGLKEVQRFDKLITRYEILASKTELTDKESRRLYQTMSLLQEKFPEVSIGLSDEADALDTQVGKLRELNAQREKEIRLRGDQKLQAYRIKRTEAGEEIEKLYKKRQQLASKAAQLERDLALNDLYLSSKTWKDAKKDIDEVNKSIAEQEEQYDKLAKRIESLNRILYPESAESSLNAWQQQIQKMRDIAVEDTIVPIFTDDEIEKWNTLDEALDAIAKRKKTVKEREDALSASIKEQTGEIRDRIRYELDWATAERVRLEAMEEFFSSQSIYAKDIADNFQELLFKTYDKEAMKRLGDEMVAAFPKATADLLARPIIDAAKLAEKGWEGAGEGIATVFSSLYDFEDDKGEKRNILVTPILPDGTVLSPDELDAYVNEIIASSDFKDDHGIVLGIDVDEDADEKLDQMQKEYYNLIALNDKLKGDSANKYLITEKELSVLDDATDVLDLIDKKISEIDKEIASISNVKLDPNISDEAKEEFENFKFDLQTIYEYFQALRERYTTDVFSGLAKNVQSLFPNLMESAFGDVDKETFSKKGLFSNKDLKGITTIVDLYGLWSSKFQSVNEELQHYNKQLKETVDLELQNKISATISSLEDQKKALEEMQKTYGFLLKTSGGSGYQQDPWILIYKNRTKFVQDFRKSVEDLNEYMAHSGALSKTRGIMSGRGAALGFDVAQMSGTRQEVLSWYDKTIEEITKKIHKLGGRTWANLGVQAILAKDTKSRTLKAWQDLLADIFKERTDFDLSQQKTDFEKAFKKMKADLKRSADVKKFYDDILDMTGDTELTQTLTFSVYGNTEARDFAQRIQQELSRAMASLDEGQLTDELREAIQKQDFGVILANIEKFEPAWQAEIKQMASDSEAFHIEEINRWLKDLEEVKTFGQRRVQLSRYTAKQIALIQASNLPEETKNKMIEGYRTRELKETKKLQYEAFKDSKMYISVFENMDTVSSRMLKNMRARLVALKGEWKDLDPVQIKELQKRIEEIDQQIADRNPFKAYIDGFKAYSALVRQGRSRSEDEKKASDAEAARKVAETNLESAIAALKEAEAKGEVSDELKQQVAAAQEAYDLAAKNADAAQENADEWNKVAQAIANAAAQLSKYADYTESILSATRGVLDAFASEDTIEWFDIASNTLSKVLDGGIKTASGVAKIISGTDVVGGVVDTVSGLAGLVAGVWGGVTASKIKKANEDIEDQEKIVNSLEKAYDRLEEAMSKSFGSDYIYNFNQQATVLRAKIDAYNKMIDAERGKGKKADEKKIEEWQEKIEEAEKTLGDMRGKLAEFFAGTDLASAAKDFATSWIDAYKEFGSTTDAIKGKFQDMIQNMITQSLAAKLIQTILDPVFQAIDTMAGDGELTASEIADISDMTLGATEDIDRALSVLMSKLAAAGYNIRQSDSQFTGISRNIATATEESINGLAAGINTQNFYMSYVPTISQDVAAIRTALVGTSAVPEAVTPSQFGDEMFRGQMSRIDENIAEIRGMLKSVITPKSASVNTHCVGMK